MNANPVTAWQHYTQLHQQLLATLKAGNSTAPLYQFAQQLTAARLALTEPAAAVLQHKLALAPALVNAEILYCWGKSLQWPQAIITLLLEASFCSSFHAELAAQAKLAMPKQPALACAKAHQHSLPRTILMILSFCYAPERRLATTRQQPLSALLTLAEQLTAAQPAREKTTPATLISFAKLRQHIAIRIMTSRSEHELNLLAILANNISQPLSLPSAPDPVAALLAKQSVIAQLPLEDYSQLEHYLLQHPVMAAWVMQRASQLNRQQQDITQVKLAISLLGSNALPVILASAELQQQLARLNVPNHDLLQQFTQCFAVALSLLFSAELTIDKAQLLAYCLCAPLWLNADNYLLALVKNQPPPGRLNLALTSLINSSDYLPQLHLLLQRYQLDAWQNTAAELIHYLTRQPTKLTLPSLSLLTAWQAAVATLTNTTQTEASLASLQQLLNRLQELAAANFSYQAHELCQAIASKSACYCPIQLNL